MNSLRYPFAIFRETCGLEPCKVLYNVDSSSDRTSLTLPFSMFIIDNPGSKKSAMEVRGSWDIGSGTTKLVVSKVDVHAGTVVDELLSLEVRTLCCIIFDSDPSAQFCWLQVY